MKKLLLATTLLFSTLSVQAENTIGIGIGSLYNGFGFNAGKTTSTSFLFGSAGCMGWTNWSSYSSSSNDDSTKTVGHETNCGLGLGYVSTAVLPGVRQGLGLSLVGTKNHIFENQSGSNLELTLMPSYYFFFKGIDKSGFNLGTGPMFTYRDGQPIESFVMFNIGFQF